MNREIKFRAWHEGLKKMFSAEELGEDEMTINPDGRGFVNVSGASQRLSEYQTNMIPLQYTGLEDKNGKEIFEGDIVRWQSWKSKPLSEGKIGQIIWDNNELGFRIEENFIEHSPAIYDKIEIIGNIYKNPKLLK